MNQMDKHNEQKRKGGDEKLREEKLKSLEGDTAKCFKIVNSLFNLATLPSNNRSPVSLKALAAGRRDCSPQSQKNTCSTVS